MINQIFHVMLCFFIICLLYCCELIFITVSLVSSEMGERYHRRMLAHGGSKHPRVLVKGRHFIQHIFHKFKFFFSFPASYEGKIETNNLAAQWLNLVIQNHLFLIFHSFEARIANTKKIIYGK